MVTDDLVHHTRCKMRDSKNHEAALKAAIEYLRDVEGHDVTKIEDGRYHVPGGCTPRSAGTIIDLDELVSVIAIEL